MKITISTSDIDFGYPLFLKNAGIIICLHHNGKESFSRPLGNNHYPRFHIYVDEGADNLTFNIHL